ncbi:GL18270 [Drosophila persimilis]|uniref:GL18270 n=1 Tax=Drosophila persimilis TaxID=7234 RepID=B4H4P7_DROPE|nr:GL18270 [Drosophila persimilis]
MCIPKFARGSNAPREGNQSTLQTAIRTAEMYQQLLREMQRPSSLMDIVEEMIYRRLAYGDKMYLLSRVLEELLTSKNLGYLRLRRGLWSPWNH